MIDRRFFRYFDWISFFLILILLTIGLTFVFSSTFKLGNYFSSFFTKQCFGIIISIFIYFFFSSIDIRKCVRLSFFLYFLILFLLLYTVIGGLIGFGAKRWISLYFINFQPSELVKFIFPLFVAYYFSELEIPHIPMQNYIPFKEFVFPLSVLFISFILILKQPDLGTALIILFTGCLLFWFIGITKLFFITVISLCLIFAPFLWTCLKPYQKNRIVVLFGRGSPRKERYQVEQSKIAIGSGGIVGKGFLNGTQNKLQFLPADHTDFIFSVVCEEIGFVGAIFVIILFGLLFIRIILMISVLQNLFEQIICIGLLLHIFLSTIINLGMVTGVLPIVGIPLPLFSYGLSNLWVTMASFGFINNISIKRFFY